MRPTGSVRLALLALLHTGASGTFDALARQANVPEHQARHTLANLRRERVIASNRATHDSAFPQRKRAVYSHVTHHESYFDALAFACKVWREPVQDTGARAVVHLEAA